MTLRTFLDPVKEAGLGVAEQLYPRITESYRMGFVIQGALIVFTLAVAGTAHGLLFEGVFLLGPMQNLLQALLIIQMIGSCLMGLVYFHTFKAYELAHQVSKAARNIEPYGDESDYQVLEKIKQRGDQVVDIVGMKVDPLVFTKMHRLTALRPPIYWLKEALDWSTFAVLIGILWGANWYTNAILLTALGLYHHIGQLRMGRLFLARLHDLGTKVILGESSDTTA